MYLIKVLGGKQILNDVVNLDLLKKQPANYKETM